jgi:hypothetical protein
LFRSSAGRRTGQRRYLAVVIVQAVLDLAAPQLENADYLVPDVPVALLPAEALRRQLRGKDLDLLNRFGISPFKESTLTRPA